MFRRSAKPTLELGQLVLRRRCLVKLLKTRTTRILYSAGALAVLALLVEAGKKVPAGGGH
jgi:hypothetical protein